MATLKDVSRTDYTAAAPTIENINAGSLQRLAAASELMARNYNTLIEEAARHKRWYEDERDRCRRHARTITALRGVITRMSRKVSQ